MIKTSKLCRDYHFKEKEVGLKGSIKYLFKPKKSTKRAVNLLDLEIKEGEFVGLIGPNGAGKTTLIKMLTGIIPPSSGEISVCGYKPADLKNDFRKQYAVVMGQKSQLWWDLPAEESFYLNKELYQIPEERFNQNLKELIDIFEVEPFLQKQVRQLSLGQRMKMEIIASLLHDPKVIFLDEPTIGLDGIAQKQIRKFLKKINQQRKTTIILTSHYMEDIKSLCERVVVINDGEKVYDGSYDHLINQVSNIKILSIECQEPIETLPTCPYEIIEQDTYNLLLKVDKKGVKELVNQLFNLYEIRDITIKEEDITDVVEKIYKSI